MEYFELSLSKTVLNPIEILQLSSEAYFSSGTATDFNLLPKMKIAYWSGSEQEEPCDILLQPTFMVSDKLKRLLALHESSVKFKAIQLFSVDINSSQNPLYWVTLFPKLKCLHTMAEKHPNGMIKNLVLDHRRIRQHAIFQVDDLLERKIIISLPVAEGILRRYVYGIGLNRIKVI